MVIAKEYRRKGLATTMLKYYVEEIKKNYTNIQNILLLCKYELIPFYRGCGFELIGPSSVEHGQTRWYEMKIHC